MKGVVLAGMMMALGLCFLHLSAVIYDHGQNVVSTWLADEWKITRAGNALHTQHPEGQAMAQYIRIQSQKMKQGRQNLKRFPESRKIWVCWSRGTPGLHAQKDSLHHDPGEHKTECHA